MRAGALRTSDAVPEGKTVRRASFGSSSFGIVSRFLTITLIAFAFCGATSASASKYAAIVVDANTGKTLFASNGDAPRYPASLTKMMTLYMIFEAMDAGKVNKNTRIPFSAHAASRPPTKLGVRAGGSITVETAIYALVTKSANDASAAVAEYFGGTESGFARQMTDKARALGMSKTTFRNASGLPDSGQRTTARDMATLGIALREHFPHHYHYFATRSFKFGKARMGNHNKLLGRIKGVDGIKTGYIRASGFNLVSSVKTGGRSIVAVVMGGRTGRSRDAHMAELIRKYLPKASTRDRGQLIARPSGSKGAVVAGMITLPRRDIPMPQARPEEELEVAAFAPAPAKRPRAEVPQASDAATEIRNSVNGVDPVKTASTVVPGWTVQVASSPNQQEALSALSRTREKAGDILSRASPFTVPFELDGVVYHRARFGGFNTKTAAWNACAALKKKKIDCYAAEQ